MEAAAAAGQMPPMGPLFFVRFTPSYMFSELFSNSQVADWLLSKAQEPPTGITPNMMKSSITVDGIILGDPTSASKYFQRAGIYFKDSSMSGVDAEPKEEDTTVHVISPLDTQINPDVLKPLFKFSGVEKVVCVLHGGDRTRIFLTMTDSRTPFSFLEKPSSVVPGVRRAVGIYTATGFMLAINYWLVDGRSNLIILNYAFEQSSIYSEIHIILLKPYPHYRYPNESDILETVATIEQKDCEFCLVRGFVHCQCTLPMIRRSRPAYGTPPLDQRDPWILWKWIWSTYDSGLKKYCSNITNYTNNFCISTIGLNLVRPTFLNRDQDEHNSSFQHYLNMVLPCFAEKLVDWARVPNPKRPKAILGVSYDKKNAEERDLYGHPGAPQHEFDNSVMLEELENTGLDPRSDPYDNAEVNIETSLTSKRMRALHMTPSSSERTSDETAELLPYKGSRMTAKLHAPITQQQRQQHYRHQRPSIMSSSDMPIGDPQNLTVALNVPHTMKPGSALNVDVTIRYIANDDQQQQQASMPIPMESSRRTRIEKVSIGSDGRAWPASGSGSESDPMPAIADSKLRSGSGSGSNVGAKKELSELVNMASGSGDNPAKIPVVSGSQDEGERDQYASYLEEVEAMTWTSTTRSTCRFCETSFSRKHDLKRHIKSKHLQEAEYHCEICGNRFRRRHHLEIHHKTIHEKSLNFPCEFCGNVYTAASTRTKHIKMMHTDVETK